MRRLVALTVALALVAGCGDDEEQQGADGSPPAAQEQRAQPDAAPVASVAIVETDFELDPRNPRIERAGLVELRVRNEGRAVHALEVEGPRGEEETEELASKEAVTLRIDLSQPGRYVMYCPVGNHRELGMEGRVTVAGDGPQGAARDGERGAGAETEDGEAGASDGHGGY